MTQYVNHDELWWDYLEGELDAAMKEDLSRVLLNSPEARAKLAQMKKLRSMVKASEAVSLPVPSDDEFFNKLSAKIEARLEKTQPRGSALLHLTSHVEGNGFRYAAGFAVAVVSLFLVLKGGAFVGRPTSVAKLESTESRFIQEMLTESALVEPGTASDSILSHEDQIDMFMDIAAQKMKTLSDSEKQQMIEQLKE